MSKLFDNNHYVNFMAINDKISTVYKLLIRVIF
jgi:hypothetical protein